MNLFKYIQNDAFFKPLTLKSHELYYDCIRILIDSSKEIAVMYETTARDILNRHLNNMKIREVDEETGTTLTGAEILMKFRECGWIAPREVGRNGEYVTEITTNCRRIMDFLHKLTEKSGQGEMSNRIFEMYEIVKGAYDEDSARSERPYTNILKPLIESESELKNELADLKDHISGIMKSVIELQDLKALGEYILKDEMLDRFFGEYFFIKNNGLIPSQLAFIRERVRWLKEDGMREKMIEECEKRESDMTYAEAKDRVDAYFSEIENFLSDEYEDHMAVIDQRINTYYNLASTRIMLMASSGIRIDSMLHNFLTAMGEVSEEESDRVFAKVAEATRITPHKYVGVRSFEKRKSYEREKTGIALTKERMSDEEKAAVTDRMFASAPDRYSVGRVSDYFESKFDESGADEITLHDRKLSDRSEALMYAAAMMYGADDEFLYEVALSKDVVDAGVADMTDVTIRRLKSGT